MSTLPYSDYVHGTKTNAYTADFTGNILVFLWGAGGGGASGLNLSRGGCGGGGGSLTISVIPVVSGSSYSYTIGTGGAGGATGGNDGSDGGDTYWDTGAAYKAKGGKKGTGTSGGAGGSTGSLGDSVINGSNGFANAGWNGGDGGDAGGSESQGGGTGGVNGGQGAGGAGVSPGGGGAGGGQSNTGAGGAGADGGIYIIAAPASNPGYYQVGISGTTYDAAGTYDWTAPADGIVIVECWGSGGGARGGAVNGGAAGAGGGGYAIKAQTVTAGTVYQRIVPAGGLGAPYNNSASNTAGSDATFKLKNSPGTILVQAHGGGKSTAITTGAGVGGTGAVGDTLTTGDSGSVGAGTVAGANGGAGATLNGGAGGLGGKKSPNTSNAGQSGNTPGGGGGGGAGTTSAGDPGVGGAGGRGAVLISYYLTFGSVIIDNEEKFIVGIKYKDGTAGLTNGTVHTIDEPYAVYNGVKKSLKKLEPDNDAGLPVAPDYIPSGYENRFNVRTGTFNWKFADKILPAIAANDFQYVVIGDSVAEGWTSYDGLFSGTQDFANAFPRWGRNYIHEENGIAIGGSGFIRVDTIVNDIDTEWTRTGSYSKHAHYISTSNSGFVGEFKGEFKGTAAAVVTSGTGTIEMFVDGVSKGRTTASTDDILVRKTVTGLTDDFHTITITNSSGNVNIFGADIYYPNVGIKCNNVAEGGGRAYINGTSPQQKAWGDVAPGAPAAQTPTFAQQVACYGRNQDAALIFLGGNDSNLGVSAANIKTAMDTIGTAFETVNTNIILMPDVWTHDRMGALMQLCLDNDWALIDFLWLTNDLQSIFGQGYNGDTFGHLKVEGAKWVGRMLQKAFLTPADTGY